MKISPFEERFYFILLNKRNLWPFFVVCFDLVLGGDFIQPVVGKGFRVLIPRNCDYLCYYKTKENSGYRLN